MKAVILAGGFGTRITEESALRPKPMIEVGGRPLLWHILTAFSAHGINDFIVCCGYKGYVIKEYFANYALHHSDITVDVARGSIETHRSETENWRVTLVDTGEKTMTGGRLKRVRPYLDDEDFFFTYGDGLSDVDLTALRAFHKKEGTLATVTAVQPPGRFGALTITSRRVARFQEKPEGDGGWINGGFFVLNPKVLETIDGDATVWENEPLAALAKKRQLSAYVHRGFWHPLDTMRDKLHLESLWNSGKAPWLKRRKAA